MDGDRRGALDGLKARLASRNPNKARELERLLPSWTIEPLDADDYPPEDGDSYYENAQREGVLRTRARGKPDEWAIGEDSGLEVAALGGGPGVRSARSGGDDPVGWLLARLAGFERWSALRQRARARISDGEERRGTGTLVG